LGQYEKIGCSDTVGAVAIDQDSRLCTGVSTGGIWMKLPGRVGDSPIVGAGLYADDSAGAVCATGIGEEIIRVCLSKTACDLMKSGVDAQTACDESIRMITRLRGSDNGGLIALDKKGRIGISWNTEVLSTAFKFDRMKRTEVSVLPKRRKL
jgi:beta-aspartyl-peptidase (threonine type)